MLLQGRRACIFVLDGIHARFARPDANGLLDIEYKDIAIADPACPRHFLNGVERRFQFLWSGTTTSIFTLGRKSTTYSAPR